MESTTALGILAETGEAWAADEIVDAMRHGDTDFIVAALEVLPNLRDPLVTETCIKLLGHGEQRIRIAALAALARMKEPRPLCPMLPGWPSDTAYSAGRGLMSPIAALHTLAAIGGPEATDYLEPRCDAPSIRSDARITNRSAGKPNACSRIRQPQDQLLQSRVGGRNAGSGKEHKPNSIQER